jgi:hypothetical protein
MPINPAQVQAIPGTGVEYRTGPSAFEALLSLGAGAAQGFTQKRRSEMNQMMQIFPTLVSEGAAKPVEPGTPGAIQYGNQWWNVDTSRLGITKALARKKTGLQIMELEQDVGLRDPSKSTVMKLALQLAQKDPEVATATAFGDTDVDALITSKAAQYAKNFTALLGGEQLLDPELERRVKDPTTRARARKAIKKKYPGTVDKQITDAVIDQWIRDVAEQEWGV